MWNIFATVYADFGSIKPVLFEKRYKFIWYFQVLEDALEWLNEWEMAFRTGDITANEYLTPETSRSFRLTLQSPINMCLIEKFDFQYFLTGMVNQDNLEVFSIYIDFCNEKTTCLWYYIIRVLTISFRNSYGSSSRRVQWSPELPHILAALQTISVYSIIKPPKFGNCTVTEQPKQHIFVSAWFENCRTEVWVTKC